MYKGARVLCRETNNGHHKQNDLLTFKPRMIRKCNFKKRLAYQTWSMTVVINRNYYITYCENMIQLCRVNEKKSIQSIVRIDHLSKHLFAKTKISMNLDEGGLNERACSMRVWTTCWPNMISICVGDDRRMKSIVVQSIKKIRNANLGSSFVCANDLFLVCLLDPNWYVNLSQEMHTYYREREREMWTSNFISILSKHAYV